MFVHIFVFWFWNSLTNTRSHAHANTVLKHALIRTQKHSRVVLKHAGRNVQQQCPNIYPTHSQNTHVIKIYKILHATTTPPIKHMGPRSRDCSPVWRPAESVAPLPFKGV